MKKARSGFTIVELLAVIGVVAVLISIIASVATNSIRAGRGKRAAVMGSSLQQAIAAYYAEEGKWPSLIESANTDGEDTVKFEGTQADQIFQEVRCFSTLRDFSYANPPRRTTRARAATTSPK